MATPGSPDHLVRAVERAQQGYDNAVTKSQTALAEWREAVHDMADGPAPPTMAAELEQNLGDLSELMAGVVAGAGAALALQGPAAAAGGVAALLSTGPGGAVLAIGGLAAAMGAMALRAITSDEVNDAQQQELNDKAGTAAQRAIEAGRDVSLATETLIDAIATMKAEEFAFFGPSSGPASPASTAPADPGRAAAAAPGGAGDTSSTSEDADGGGVSYSVDDPAPRRDGDESVTGTGPAGPSTLGSDPDGALTSELDDEPTTTASTDDDQSPSAAADTPTDDDSTTAEPAAQEGSTRDGAGNDGGTSSDGATAQADRNAAGGVAGGEPRPGRGGKEERPDESEPPRDNDNGHTEGIPPAQSNDTGRPPEAHEAPDVGEPADPGPNEPAPSPDPDEAPDGGEPTGSGQNEPAPDPDEAPDGGEPTGPGQNEPAPSPDPDEAAEGGASVDPGQNDSHDTTDETTDDTDVDVDE